MCLMHVLVMKELQRQYWESNVFVEDYANDQSLVNAII